MSEKTHFTTQDNISGKQNQTRTKQFDKIRSIPLYTVPPPIPAPEDMRRGPLAVQDIQQILQEEYSSVLRRLGPRCCCCPGCSSRQDL